MSNFFSGDFCLGSRPGYLDGHRYICSTSNIKFCSQLIYLSCNLYWRTPFLPDIKHLSGTHNNGYFFESPCVTCDPGRTGAGRVHFASLSCCLATQLQLQYAFAASGWSKPKAPALVGYASNATTVHIDPHVMVSTRHGQPETSETKEHRNYTNCLFPNSDEWLGYFGGSLLCWCDLWNLFLCNFRGASVWKI